MENKKNTSPEWPIVPTFLSLRNKRDENSANYNADGIYYTDYIRGFLADLSHEKDIQNAMTIFQFVPYDFLPYDPNAENPEEIPKKFGKATVILNEPLDPKIKEIINRQKKKIIRIESGTFKNNGRLCDVFRKCNCDNISFCFKQDSIVGIFADEQLNAVVFTSEKYQQRLNALICEFNLSRNKINKIQCEEITVSKNKRFYIHYTCPYSLFEEHIFPIYVQGRIIACLMLGQMARDSFVKKESFSCYWKRMKEIDEKSHQYLSDICSLSSEDWKKKLTAIIKRLEIFEDRLEDRIEHKNSRYIKKAFADVERQFREDVKGINIKKQDAFSKFSKALNTAFESIRREFDHSEDGFIRMFALPIGIKHEELIPIGWSGAVFDVKDDFNFALKLLNGIDNLSPDEQKDIILEAASQKIKNRFDESKGDLFLPGWLAGNEIAYIVWKRHDKILYDQPKTFEEYKQALRNFYSVALECYSYIRGTKMELLLEMTIQESAHESTHFILPAIDVVENKLEMIPERYIIPSPVYNAQYQKALEKHIRNKEDILESLNQLKEINYGSSLIISPKLQIEKKPVQVYRLLFKLKKMFSSQVMDSHKDIYYEQNEDYVEANIDAKYLNHALFNLLDNAIKYGYEGSVIRINMNVDREESLLFVEFVSYGIEVEEGDRIYQLFERSEQAAKIASGTGIGMYIVKKICEAHGGEVTHQSEKLSDYNIPVLFNSKNTKSIMNNLNLGQIIKIENEISRLVGPIEHEVVCDYSFVKYARVFSTRINQPTYRNTFCITIPLD